MEISLNAWLARNGKTQAELALAIGLNRPTLCRKVNNVRPWKQDEINAGLDGEVDRSKRCLEERVDGLAVDVAGGDPSGRHDGYVAVERPLKLLHDVGFAGAGPARQEDERGAALEKRHELPDFG